MSDEIKRCPFCGTEGQHTPHAAGPGGHAEYWGCGRCEVYFDSLEEWNSRSRPEMLHGLVVHRRNELTDSFELERVHLFEDREKRDEMDHELLMKGRHYEAFEVGVE